MAALGAACGGTGDGPGASGDKDGGGFAGDDATMFGDDGPGGAFVGQDGAINNGPDVNGPLAIAPADDVIDINYGQTPMPVPYAATINGYHGGGVVLDRPRRDGHHRRGDRRAHAVGEHRRHRERLGDVRRPEGLDDRHGSHPSLMQNGSGAAPIGDAGVGDAGAGDGAASDGGAGGGGNAGGNGGVGGEGAGGPVDTATQGVLQGGAGAGGDAGSDAGGDAGTGPGWIYPYDQTVWPRGLLAPLLQWAAPQTYDAVYIHLSENAFDYQGFFAATATPFIHHPIPQAAWDLLCNSNQGEKVAVTLVFSSGGQVYGPITESWTVAQATLTGTVYYNSYGTNLAHNFTGNGVTFGGATLGIKRNATSPVLVAGNDSECRVCHSVSADGSRLVTGNGNTGGTGEDPASDWYDLMNGYAESKMAPVDGQFNWGTLTPDGTLLLNNGAVDANGLKLQGSSAEDTGPTLAQLFSVATGATFPSTGIPAGLIVGSPVFSSDGKHVAFNFLSGTVPTAGGDAGAGDAGAGDAGADAGGALVGDGVSLAVMDYDPTASAFSNFRVVFTPPPAAGYAVWPSFLPTNDALVFELETQSNGRDWGGTRSPCDSTACASQTNLGTKAELWWVDIATRTAARLDGLNGHGYLPTMAATDHTNDEVLNYEPTANPVPSGGYAWVVFTSRRLYGNIATLKPYWSDPRFVDLSTQPTPKKLWVAAVDLKGTPGADSSHPAFYLPAQELLAGNSRGYWVVDPCEMNGTTCQTGAQCCGGYCEGTDDAGFVCSAQPPACSSLGDKCATDDDCCGVAQGTAMGTQCIGGRCAQPVPTPPGGPR